MFCRLSGIALTAFCTTLLAYPPAAMLAAMMRRIEAKGQAYLALVALALAIGALPWAFGAVR